ncbi:HAMP domain-containing sensor histidine kinase [Enterococcus sp.]|uniref:sensor histidine kinase n=1 Tax=Enterococcus sp. TaxID=35783 RepID=UPI00290B11FE|nr:HAMP domain-containing sensor histidine kinase [Enterococcus sp.]MDU5333336.1 HAMP domain-containing sensor histidine kinase [Enterococcus sp.]
MNYRKNSLTRSFILRVGIIFILMLLLAALFYRWIFPTYYYWRMEQPVKDAQQAIQKGENKQFPDDLIVVSLENKDANSEEELTEELTFGLNREGISLNRFWVDRTTINAVKSGRSVQRLYQQNKQKSDFYTIFFNHGDTFYLVGTSIPDFKAAVHTLLPILAAATLLFLLIIFGLMILLVRKQIIEPLRRLEQTTRNISKLDFADSDVHEENELGSLSQSINQMKHSLQQHEKEMLERNDQLKDFSSNLAHELKTPLSVMQLLVDGENMGLENPTFLEDIDQQLAKMNDLVRDILSYSRQLKKDIQLEKVSIQEVVEQEVKQQQLIDPNFQIRLELEKSHIQTNEQLLRMILVNLLTNGLKYSLDKQMKISGKIRGDHYQLIFENTAKSLTNQQFSQLAEPFVVGEESRNDRLSGTGLGLSIVNESLKSLGGDLLLQQGNDHFSVTVNLPIDQETAH